jgi:DNA-binding transcriptional ArsR family regulator
MMPMTAFAAVAEPSRRQILDLLRGGERSVGDLVARVGLSQPGVSKHLRVLRQAGLVEVRPEGKLRWYRLRALPLAEVDRWLAPYRAHWSERLDALERHLEENPE